MTQRSLYWPIGLTVLLATLLLLLIGGGLPAPIAAQGDDCAIVYPSPGADREACYATATAVAEQERGLAYPSPSSTNTSAPAPQATSQPSATPTSTATSTPGSAVPTTSPAPSATSTPTVTREPIPPTPTAELIDGAALIVCIPGSTVELTGTAQPRTALLIYYDQRPVGGGLSGGDGSFRLLLRVGRDRPGRYPLEVQERDSQIAVLELVCEVPALTPTPTPVR